MILQQLGYNEDRMVVTTIEAQSNSLSPVARSLPRSSASALSIVDRAFLVQAVQTSLTEDASLAQQYLDTATSVGLRVGILVGVIEGVTVGEYVVGTAVGRLEGT